MIDGGSAAIAAGKVAVGTAPGAIRKAVRIWRLSGVIDPGYLRIETLSGDAVDLTVSEIGDIEAFLSSPQLRPLLTLVVAGCLLGDGSPGLNDSLGTQFKAEARRWCTDSNQKWDKHSEAVWERVADALGLSFPSPERWAGMASDIEQFSGYVRSVLLDGSPTSVAELNVERILDLAANLQRVAAAIGVASSMTALERERSLPPIMSHSDIDNPPDFAKLYVARTLQDSTTGESVSSHDITHSEEPFRLVLLGNPGAGKSTFVRNLAHELASKDDATDVAQACVVVRCREYLKSGSFREPIVDYVLDAQRTAGVPKLTIEALSDALLLGQIVVIFDGLDEITQVLQRSEMVERIETFTRTFPLTSVMVTSREVGYDRAHLDERLFQHTSLREFSDEQITDYTNRWFTAQSAQHLIEPFMRESQSVLDLRRSPLLLSLLCVLYRARGSLPRLRLEVYSRCADLLFHKWDSYRQIDQPEELPKYGHRVMQEIARWVFESPAAQEGIPESQLVKVVQVYLGGVGIGEEEAKFRAKDFVDFCAGRAWLLGSFGTTKMDERIFQFTHRTFFEYFTAEALARSSKDAENVSAHIRAAFTKDETSVLPELLIQAYDEKQERGGPEVFKALCARSGVDGGLILRLMNGSLLSNYVRDQGFHRIIESWKKDKSTMGREAFDALFTLEPNAFDQFVQQYVALSEPNRRWGATTGALEMLAHGWATSYLRHREHHASEGAALAAQDVATLIAQSSTPPDWDLAVWNWLVAAGYLPLPEDNNWLFLTVGTSSGTAPGAIPAVIARWLLRPNTIRTDAATAMLNSWLDSLATSTGIPASFAERMWHSTDVGVRSANFDPILISECTGLDKAAFESMLAIRMIGSELGYEMHQEWMVEAAMVRYSRLNPDIALPDGLGRKVADTCKSFPEWARLWILGDLSLTGGDVPPLAGQFRGSVPQLNAALRRRG